VHKNAYEGELYLVFEVHIEKMQRSDFSTSLKD
jgi:hypothetical protein